MRKIISNEQVFPAPGQPAPRGVINVVKRTIQEDDGFLREQYIWPRGSFVVVVPVCEGMVLIKREFKYAAFEELLTFAAGAIKAGESAAEAAERELLEEFGKRAKNFTLLAGDLANSPDKTTERQFIFLAGVGRETEPHEVGDVLEVPLSEARGLFGHPQMNILLHQLALHKALDHLGA